MIDLHTHSNTSDGTDTPRELINKALARGLTTVALTDHDTISGWNEAIEALRPGLTLVPGAEISCQTEAGISVHMLGLLFDPENGPLKDSMARTRDNRFGRMEKIIGRLNQAGFEITMADVLSQLADGATLGRPHLADALIAKKYVRSREEAFNELLHNNSKYYVTHYSATPEDTIAMIKAAGGVAIIAHPMASLRGRTIPVEVFESLVAAGLDGIEIHHRDHSALQQEELKSVANDFGLAITGSSDYHGNGKMNLLGEFTTHPDQWELLLSKASERRVYSV